MSKKATYWFSYRMYAKGARLPISKEGWWFTIIYLVIGLIAVFATVPRSENPSFLNCLPLLIVALLLTCTYITVSTLKAEPKPPKK